VPRDKGSLLPWRFSREQLLESGIRLRGLIQHSQELLELFSIQRKQSLIQQDIDGVLACTFKYELTSCFAYNGGGAVD
jgi:hypothetical protein